MLHLLHWLHDVSETVRVLPIRTIKASHAIEGHERSDMTKKGSLLVFLQLNSKRFHSASASHSPVVKPKTYQALLHKLEIQAYNLPQSSLQFRVNQSSRQSGSCVTRVLTHQATTRMPKNVLCHTIAKQNIFPLRRH